MTHALFCCIPGRGFSALGTVHENKWKKSANYSQDIFTGLKKNLEFRLALITSSSQILLALAGKS